MKNTQTEEQVKTEGRDVVFISHAYADMELALRLKKAIEGAFPSATILAIQTQRPAACREIPKADVR